MLRNSSLIKKSQLDFLVIANNKKIHQFHKKYSIKMMKIYSGQMFLLPLFFVSILFMLESHPCINIIRIPLKLNWKIVFFHMREKIYVLTLKPENFDNRNFIYPQNVLWDKAIKKIIKQKIFLCLLPAELFFFFFHKIIVTYLL